MRNIVAPEKNRFFCQTSCLLCIILPIIQAKEMSKFEEEYTRQYIYELQYILGESNISKDEILKNRHFILSTCSLNNKEYLELLKNTFYYYLIEESHNKELYVILTNIIEFNKNRKFNHDAYIEFLENILYYADNRHQSSTIITKIIEQSQIEKNTDFRHKSKLLFNSFLNDNPKVVESLLKNNIISNHDNLDALELLFLSHTYIRVKLPTYKAENPFLPGERSHMKYLGTKNILRERENGISIVKILQKYNFKLNTKKCLNIINNINNLNKCAPELKLQHNAAPLFDYIRIIDNIRNNEYVEKKKGTPS